MQFHIIRIFNYKNANEMNICIAYKKHAFLQKLTQVLRKNVLGAINCISLNSNGLLVTSGEFHYSDPGSIIRLAGWMAGIFGILCYLLTTVATSIPTRRNYLIFSFPRFKKVKCCVKCRLSTLNTWRIRRKVGNENTLLGTECFNISFPGSLYIPCYVRDTAYS